MKSFGDYLLSENRRGGTKTGLYPFGYDGIGNYPPAYLLPSAADALYYLSIDERFASWWEGAPFDITHLKGKVVPHGPHGLPGKEVKPKDSPLPGAPKPPKWKIPAGVEKKPEESPLPGAPKRDCLVKQPKTLKPTLAGPAAEKSVCDKELWPLPD